MTKGDIFRDKYGDIWECSSTQVKEWGGMPMGGFLIRLYRHETYNPHLVWDDQLKEKKLVKLCSNL